MKAITSASGMVEVFTNSVKNFLGLNIHKDDPQYEVFKKCPWKRVAAADIEFADCLRDTKKYRK